MSLWTAKSWFNFRIHPLLDTGTGTFERILQHCKLGHFPTIWLVSLEKLIGSLCKFIIDVSLSKEVPLKVIRIQSPDADVTRLGRDMFECCCFTSCD